MENPSLLLSPLYGKAPSKTTQEFDYSMIKLLTCLGTQQEETKPYNFKQAIAIVEVTQVGTNLS